jgi:uncharacterized cupredoxin-like copper-binding protein
MTPRRLIAALVPALGAAALLGGCGNDNEGTKTPAATTPTATTPATATTGKAAGGVAVQLGEYFIRPTPASVSAGTVRFTARNTGRLEHELVVIKTNLAPDKLPVSGSQVEEEKAGQVPGEVEDVEPGETKSARIKLTSGKYVFICNVPGHYAAGQRIGFTVQ